MKCYIYLAIFQLLLNIPTILSQDWAWLGGDKMADQLARLGHPGGRSASSVWAYNGTVWMFGGNGFSDLSAGKSRVLNDVWTFTTSTQKFELSHPGTWSSMPAPQSSSSAVPEGRQHAAMCGTDDSEMLVVFGGFRDAGSALGDLWTYDTKEKGWTEVLRTSHLNTSDDEAAHGPQARGQMAVWCHETFMYIFGGINDNSTVFSDMWRLNLTSLRWSQMFPSVPAEEEDTASDIPSFPAGRNGAATWTSHDVFYMFGGNTDPSYSYTLHLAHGLTSDLWRYDPVNNTWQFMTGPTPSNAGCLSGHKSATDQVATQFPGCRLSAAPWTDSQGNLWIFGGTGIEIHSGTSYHSSKLLSDVWIFHFGYMRWVFMGGSEEGESMGHYEDIGEQSHSAMPGARTEMMAWRGGCNQAYVFGGLGHDGMHRDGYLNDLWSVDVTDAITRQYLISTVSLILFLSVSCTLLLVVVVLALSMRQQYDSLSNGWRLQHGVMYRKVDDDEC